MSLIMVENLTKSFGGRLLFDNISFEVGEKEHIGLVGANGTGKSTLFKLVTGEEEADSGNVVRSKNLKLGYMEQFLCREEKVTPYELLMRQSQHLIQMEEELSDIARSIENGGASDELLERQHLLTENFERSGGLVFRSLARSALIGLGFTEDEINRPVAKLSGGQRSKVSLACLLVSGANLLLLDEPTNHLDINAIEWLEEFLRAYKGAYVVVSHDRYFLDRVTARTLELEHERLASFEGGYTAYLTAKEKNREIQQKHYENKLKEIERLKSVVAEQKRWNREKSVKRAESKEKVIKKLENSLEAPEREMNTIRFKFETANPGPTDILEAVGLSMSFQQKRIYEAADLYIRRGEKVFLLGANGCGKTTLLRQLTGQYSGLGSIRYGIGVKTAYYDQAQESLDETRTVLDEVWSQAGSMDQTQIRNALAAFLFRGDDVYNKVADLSGGEKARVAILKMMLSGANFLLLDEPTNHLDIGSREALEQALTEYNGTILMVSHDRYLINRLSDRIYYLTDHGVQEFKGGYDAYWKIFRESAEPPKTVEKPKSGGNEYKKRKEIGSRLRKLKSKVMRLEQELEEVGKETEMLEKALVSTENLSDYARIIELTAQLESVKVREAELMEQWENASVELEGMETLN